MVRNNWHLFKPWRLMTGQGYCIIKSVLPLRYPWILNESASNEVHCHIDTWHFWNPAKDHWTGHLHCRVLAVCIHPEWIRPSDTLKFHYLRKGRIPNILVVTNLDDGLGGIVAGFEPQEYFLECNHTWVSISLSKLHHIPPDVVEW